MAIDRLIAAGLMLAAVPIIGICAILIKLTSRGPAFYTQTRVGLNGRPFQIWKLRTMIHNCEAVTGPVWSGRNDRRITPIGRFLRDSYLDELPQLWNVLRGDMSMVGPRPERPEIARRLAAEVPGFELRLLVRPGLTGLAQLRLPPDEDVANIPHKLAHDVFYILNQGPLLDLFILISTGFVFISRAFACASKIFLALLVPSIRHDETIEAQIEDLMQRTAETDLPAARSPAVFDELAEFSAAA